MEYLHPDGKKGFQKMPRLRCTATRVAAMAHAEALTNHLQRSVGVKSLDYPLLRILQ